MNRLSRHLWAALFLGLFGICGTAAADQPKHVVILESMTLPVVQGTAQWFQRELSSHGFRPGEEVVYSVLNAEGEVGRAKELLEALSAERPVDLVASFATLASRAADQTLAGTGVPQVFGIVADPVGEGFTSALGVASGRNITGITHVLGPEVILSQVNEVLAQPNGERFRIAFTYSTYPSSTGHLESVLAVAPSYPQIEIVPLRLDYRPEDGGMARMLEDAVRLVQQDPRGFDGLWVGRGPAAHNRSFTNGIMNQTELPIIVAHDIHTVTDGALLALISNEETNGRALGRLAARILRGEDPGSLPVQRPTEFLAAVNISTAMRLGVAPPSDLMELAGVHVYR